VTLPDVEVVVVRDEQGIRQMYEDLKRQAVVAFDIETYGLDEQQEHSDIICISYCAKPEKAYVVLLNHPERTGDRQEMEKLLRQVHGLPVVWVAHNGKFDCRWLDRFGLVAPKLKADTIIMAHLMDETSPKSVEAVASRYLGIPTWKHLMADHFKAIADAIQKGYAIPAPPLEDLARYAALDAAIERMLFDELRRRMTSQQKRLHGFLVQVSRVLQGVEQVGVPVSRDELERAMEHSRKEMRRATLRAAKLLKKEPSEVKLSSPQWLAQILFGELQLPVVEFTDGGAPTTSEYSLKRVKQYSPKLIQAILDYRKHQKYIGSYLEPWSRKLTPDGRLRSNYNITGTVTGRLACTNVQTFPREKMGMSLHQVPRDGEIRSVVTAPPGRKLVVADYSQIELRVAAALANEKRMMLAYQRGEDIHTLTAATITGKPLDQVTKEDRQRAKSVNFGFLYGMGARNFVRYAFEQYDLEFTLEEAQQVRNRFFSLYPGLVAWHREVEDFVLRHGYVVSPLGRVRHLPDVHSQDKYLRSEAVRQAINSPVQATASDFTLAAMVLVDKALKERPDLEAVVIGQVHDSILLECPDQHAMAVAELVKKTMEEETPAYVERQFGYRFPIPLAAEVSIGSSWGKYEKVLA